jgi:molecular chaperone GrpE
MSKAAAKEAKTPSTSPETPAPASTAATEAAPESAVAPASQVTLSAQEFEELRVNAGKAAENWDRLLRTTADFDNFRKRAAREKQEAIKYANESLLTKLIPVLDSFDAAIAVAQASPDQDPDPLHTGIALVHQQFRAALTEVGLEEVDATGQVFDPNWHEAISQQECAETPEGRVLQQVRKGYKLRDRLLRPASVIVAKQPTEAKAVETNGTPS